jgi:hypothetical protein
LNKAKFHIMKSTLSITTILLSIILFCQCSPSESPTKEETKHTEHVEHTSQMKDGKWIVDNRMNEILLEMDKLVLSIPAEASVEEINTKGEQLNDLIIQLVKSCSMKGEAHDALHELLEPLMEACELMQDENSETAKEAVLSAIESMKIYQENFVAE